MGLLRPRELRRHIISCRELKAPFSKTKLNSVRRGFNLEGPVTSVTLSN